MAITQKQTTHIFISPIFPKSSKPHLGYLSPDLPKPRTHSANTSRAPSKTKTPQQVALPGIQPEDSSASLNLDQNKEGERKMCVISGPDSVWVFRVNQGKRGPLRKR
ncbi:hypothetical protein CEXT_22851 [Caerostris extrusa]|uniref:Uncharacterized protein n=1 Tax=Caerostris extrusa TaxID=172846 RepID=A0AAV4VB47_CAEEX|nr:hypothetical protein CEXT_22851 [Caerostris extrusa]